MMVKESANGLGDLGSILVRVTLKDSKMVLDASCLILSIIRYVEQGKELRSPLQLGVIAIEKEPKSRPWLRSANYYIYIYIYI